MGLLYVNLLSLLFLGMAAFAYTRKATITLTVSSVLFVPTATWAALSCFYASNPVFTIVLLVLTLLLPLVAVALYLVDVLFAPFCLEMTYLTILCWILCPVLVIANVSGMVLT